MINKEFPFEADTATPTVSGGTLTVSGGTLPTLPVLTSNKEYQGKATITHTNTVVKNNKYNKIGEANTLDLEKKVLSLEQDKTRLLNVNSEFRTDIRLIIELVKLYLSPIIKEGNLTMWSFIKNSKAIFTFIKELLRVIKRKGYIPDGIK